MLTSPLTTNRLLLRNLSLSDVGDRYLEWLRDPVINRYLEVRFQEHMKPSVEAFIDSVNRSSDSILFGIFLADGDRHIGNIKLGPINRRHHRAEISLLLGERAEWGKGYASEAIRAVSDFGLDRLGLHKIAAGCYEDNVGSLRAFIKAGYSQEASLPDHWEVDGRFQAQLWLGITHTADEDRPSPGIVSFEDVQSLTFIGGGTLMIAAASYAKGIGYEVNAILAPRHAREPLNDGQTTDSALRSSGVEVAVVDDVNHWNGLTELVKPGSKSLALCFGPAWIFSNAVIRTFAAGMFNFNGIPIPHYLGGAHYTWQILNGNRNGGCFLQEITERVDQGDVFRHEYFDLPESLRVPQDYFEANFKIGVRFLSRLLDDMKQGVAFERTPYAGLNAKRLYFPRLFTRENAYIDWRWNGLDIERFCNAFDKPYLGAATSWHGQEVRLHEVCLVETELRFHPFVSGLVVRKSEGYIWIAARDGLIKVALVVNSGGQTITKDIREGDRLVTPDDKLWHSKTYSPKYGSAGISN